MPGGVKNQWNSRQSLVEAAAFVEHTMVAKSLAVVTGKDDDCIFGLSGFLQRFKKSSELVVDQGDHRVVVSLNTFAVELGRVS